LNTLVNFESAQPSQSDQFSVGVNTNETVVPASELQEAMRRIKQLEGALGRKTLENEILKEAVDFAKAKKWIARSPVLPGDEQ
jgi:transposase